MANNTTGQERALREALEPFAKVADEYHDSEDDSFEVWQDAGPIRTIRASFKLENYRRARAALALPHQPATDEGRYRDALEQIQQATIDGKVCDDVAWFDKFTTLHDFIEETLRPSAPAAVGDLFPSTPTSQPPAAETRLRAIEQAACRVLDAIDTCRNSHTEEHQVTAGAELDEATENMRASLTQPEPTAQQGGEEEGNDYPKCPVCGAPAGMDCRTIQGRIPPHSERLSAQQAAGEAVAWMLRERKTGQFYWDDEICIWSHPDDAEEHATENFSDPDAYEVTPLYAAPQPEAPAEVQQGVVLDANDQELVALLRREGLHSNVWFAESLLKAANLIQRLALATPQQGQEVEAIAKVIAKAYNPGLFDGDETERLRAASPHNVHHAQAVEMTLARKAAQAVIGLPSTPTAAGESQ